MQYFIGGMLTNFNVSLHPLQILLCLPYIFLLALVRACYIYYSIFGDINTIFVHLFGHALLVETHLSAPHLIGLQLLAFAQSMASESWAL